MTTPTDKKSFPIARKLWKLAKRALLNWRERHQHPFNFAIHMAGIPIAYIGLLFMILAPFGWSFGIPWTWGLAGFVLGFVLQWLGHCVEGNDVGEWAGIKKLLGWPAIGVSPRYKPFDRPETS